METYGMYGTYDLDRLLDKIVRGLWYSRSL